ncbi:unnamed protein product [Urochloa humidicola]
MAKYSPLHKVTDDARWDAEDLFGRLCILAHAAFLYAGFHPSAVQEVTPWSLSRSYSVLPPETAAEIHQDAAAVVLRLYRPWGRRWRGRAHMSLRAHVAGLAASNVGRYMEHRERLCCADLGTVLAGGLDDAARVIRAPGSVGERLWKLVADGICRGLFLYACKANGVPVMPDFASLPGDTKLAILEKLKDGKDVAMAECASNELRSLVAGHGSNLWKAKYEATNGPCPRYFRIHGAITNVTSWKQRYVEARRFRAWVANLEPRHELGPKHYRLSWMKLSMLWEIKMMCNGSIPKPRSIRMVVREEQKQTAQRRAEFEEKSHRRSAARAMAKVPKRFNRKEHRTGAVQSSSLHYQRKHR